jgi:hypothetical protein
VYAGSALSSGGPPEAAPTASANPLFRSTRELPRDDRRDDDQRGQRGKQCRGNLKAALAVQPFA